MFFPFLAIASCKIERDRTSSGRFLKHITCKSVVIYCKYFILFVLCVYILSIELMLLVFLYKNIVASFCLPGKEVDVKLMQNKCDFFSYKHQIRCVALSVYNHCVYNHSICLRAVQLKC